MNIEVSEGGKCPECDGKMVFPKVENCSCHINPPCSACVENRLTCDKCGWKYEPPLSQELVRHIGGGLSEVIRTKPSRELGNGKRLLDYDYDSRSGSTMVWTGKYAGPVTAQDIIEAFGDGTFGHRGPWLDNGRFSYTQITD